jgi:hypothetical protein
VVHMFIPIVCIALLFVLIPILCPSPPPPSLAPPHTHTHTPAQAAFQAELEDLLEDYRALTQQIKLKNLIIACFIPPQYQVGVCGCGGVEGRGLG